MTSPTPTAQRPSSSPSADAQGVPPQALHLWELVSTASTPLGVVDEAGAVVHSNAALDDLLAQATFLAEWLRDVEATQAKRTSVSVPGQSPVELYLEALRDGHRLLFAWREDATEPGADRDPLTGLGSRARFERLLKSERYDTLLLLDLDRFKAINDTLGHDAGDQLLKLAAKRLLKAIRNDDPIVRLGGDEFAIFHCVGEGGVATAVRIAERIIKLLGGPFLVDSQTVHVGASVGVASLRAGDTSREELYRHADLALYAAKANGRNRYWCFEEALEAQANDRREMEAQLRQALMLGQLRLYYQPQVDTTDRHVCGVEALLRWDHPHRGELTPEHFVPMAEEIGEIRPIGEWVLRHACAHASEWPNELSVAVNVSAGQIIDPRFIDTVRAALDAAKLAPARLELEVTEGVLMSNFPLILERLSAAKALGVSVTLDEFGTGYSSLNYLNRFPFSRIKIARSFVRGQQDDPRARNLVKCVLALGDSLGISTLASGIETQAQCDALIAIGCREGQGWLFGAPLNHEDLGAYLREHELSPLDTP
ncbi:MAG: bifunctional diguanylate cyclase/phosphodiesterase [Pseudomonadota bacterium]